MNRMVSVFLALAIAAPAMAGEPVDKSLKADSDGDVVIQITRGNVSIAGWDRNEVTVKGTRDDSSTGFTMERHGKVITIEDKVEHGMFHWGSLTGKGTSIKVMVPHDNGVKESLVSVDTDVRDIRGPVRVDTVSGDIKADNLGGDVQLDTVSGNIIAGTNSARMKMKAVSGDIKVNNGKPIRQAELSTVSGNVKLDSAVSDDGELTMKSVSGDLVFTFRGKLNARFNAQTGPGGNISNELTDARPEKSRYAGEETLKLMLGDGGADISASVVSGDITLRKP